ncbi:MAG: cyanate lyase, partial [Natronomonas sp.]
MLSRDAATERLLDAKDDADIRFDDLATTVDRDPVWVAAAVYGQVSMGVDEADALCSAMGVDDPEVRALLQSPATTKGEDDPTFRRIQC